MVDFKKLSQKRYSARIFQEREVEREKIDYILECARLAPSANNLQPWFFYVVSSDEGREAVQESYPREWFKSAPLYIVVCANRGQSWKRLGDESKGYPEKNFSDVDAAITAEHICLATAAVGLGTCWVCNFRPDILNKALNLSVDMEVIAMFPIGYIDESAAAPLKKKRKSIDEISEWL